MRAPSSGRGLTLPTCYPRDELPLRSGPSGFVAMRLAKRRGVLDPFPRSVGEGVVEDVERVRGLGREREPSPVFVSLTETTSRFVL